MATPVKISALPLLSTAPATTVEFPINDGGTTKKLTLDNLLTRVGSLSSLTAGITNTSIVNAINSIYALDATPSTKGFVTTTGQAFAGDKTFNGSVILDGNQLSFKSNGSFYAVLKARTTQTGSYILNLPLALPGSTSFLTVDSSGNMAYAVGGVTSIATGAGLTGGPITSTGTISLATTGVAVGSYGGTNIVPLITVDAYGRLTAVSNLSLPTADASRTGVLTSADWNTFNSKLSAPTITSNHIPYWDGSAFQELSNFKVDTITTGAVDAVYVPNISNSGLEVSNSFSTINSNTAINASNSYYFIEPGGAANVTVTLPDTNTVETGQKLYFKVINSVGGTIKLAVPGSDDIDGAAELTISSTYGSTCIIKRDTGFWSVLYNV